MIFCPIAIVAGCKRCPAYKICPLKGVIGDKPAAPVVLTKPKAAAKRRSPAAKKK